TTRRCDRRRRPRRRRCRRPVEGVRGLCPGRDPAGRERCSGPVVSGAVAASITITDNRTGETVEVPSGYGGVEAAARSLPLPGMRFYDPALMTTAVASSSITEVDGENGILRYRGYPIEQLAEHSSFLEVAYLLIHGELPTKEQYDPWVRDITYHTY